MTRTKDMVSANVVRETEAARDLIRALMLDDAELSHDMIEGETGLFEAVAAAIGEIDDCDVISAGCREKEAQFADRRARAERRVERLRGLIEQAMAVAELPTIKLPTATLTVKTLPPKPLIEDEALVPSEFWRQPDPVLDRAKINSAVKDGATIPGVTRTNGQVSLQIRRA